MDKDIKVKMVFFQIIQNVPTVKCTLVVITEINFTDTDPTVTNRFCRYLPILPFPSIGSSIWSHLLEQSKSPKYFN